MRDGTKGEETKTKKTLSQTRVNGSEQFHSYTQIRKFKAENMKFSSIYPIHKASVLLERKTLSSTTNFLFPWSNRTDFFGNQADIASVWTKTDDRSGSQL